ncbi:hypothetical protein ACWT_5914 [Actinoplanes sp. SE50]|uniref:mycofactocin precursor MftA n=1 Tax=unclassified Actinoplanes TaxID=2626549 RepID=UPI00023EBFA7|nr:MULTISPECIES: mycofactocin precursor MftA [unclassified Actinoplanes]AEV86933.1 hypothetical protein ACPL_6046 [Actinoplanes sp. SE50/110]ATO85329.1 hypothetical protein ACWT_5914 [Actinoplanes sp. SE50]SLM02740.1 mycofactocin precursor [Actinoplanes sp. SE50/110]
MVEASMAQDDSTVTEPALASGVPVPASGVPELLEELLVESVSIDGMCGVY